jgi:hypothetical protein
MAQASSTEINNLIKHLQDLNYAVYSKPNELNIIGVRTNNVNANSFDDLLYVFWKNDNGSFEGKKYPLTTDPGTYWLKNPMVVAGTAILKAGQYINAYQVGKHRGKYDALTQKGNVTVFRDYDRNAILDYNNGNEATGLYGINIHNSGDSEKDDKGVDKWSAGCQVFKNMSDFNEFMVLAKKHKDKYVNSFTYTLIDERAYDRKVKRFSVYTLLGVLAAVAAYVLYRSYNNKPLIPGSLSNLKNKLK